MRKSRAPTDDTPSTNSNAGCFDSSAHHHNLQWIYLEFTFRSHEEDLGDEE